MDCTESAPEPLAVQSSVGRSGEQTRCCAGSCLKPQTTSASPSEADEELKSQTVLQKIKSNDIQLIRPRDSKYYAACILFLFQNLERGITPLSN